MQQLPELSSEAIFEVLDALEELITTTKPKHELNVRLSVLKGRFKQVHRLDEFLEQSSSRFSELLNLRTNAEVVTNSYCENINQVKKFIHLIAENRVETSIRKEETLEAFYDRNASNDIIHLKKIFARVYGISGFDLTITRFQIEIVFRYAIHKSSLLDAIRRLGGKISIDATDKRFYITEL